MQQGTMKLNEYCAKNGGGFALIASLLSVAVAAYGFRGYVAPMNALVAFSGMGLLYSALFITSWQRRASLMGIASALLVILSSPFVASWCFELLNHQGDSGYLQCIGLFSLALSTSLWGMHDSQPQLAVQENV